jgi:hypothetical protein
MLIATRVLKFHQGGSEIEIPVRLFAPEQENGAWQCRYEIDWPHGRWAHAASGSDAVQALFIAMQLAGATIYASDYHSSGHLTWGRPGRGYGFPVPVTVRDMLVGDDKKFC